jgi:hypothetical protein
MPFSVLSGRFSEVHPGHWCGGGAVEKTAALSGFYLTENTADYIVIQKLNRDLQATHRAIPVISFDFARDDREWAARVTSLVI